MLYLNNTCNPGFNAYALNLTLTNVVFEFGAGTVEDIHGSYLTLTNVVFELFKYIIML